MSLSQLFQKNKKQYMGVINTTPDSFSDGGCADQLFSFYHGLRDHQKKAISLVDVGAQSTAPMNPRISWEDEWQRLERTLIPFLECNAWPFKWLSLDTYYAEVMNKFLKFKIQQQLSFEVIWNDVSGKADESVHELLKEYPHLNYVYSHNLAPHRNLSGKHMQYVRRAEHLSDWIEYFARAQRKFKQWKVSERVLFDPCFGFAKSREQNLALLEQLPQLIKHFPEKVFLIGISRKSFLRNAGESVKDPLIRRQLDTHQMQIIQQWCYQLPHASLLFRVHHTQ